MIQIFRLDHVDETSPNTVDAADDNRQKQPRRSRVSLSDQLIIVFLFYLLTCVTCFPERTRAECD